MGKSYLRWKTTAFALTLVFFATFGVTASAKPKLDDSATPKQEFKFTPYPLPEASSEAGEVTIEGKPGNVTFRTKDGSGTVAYVFNELDAGSVVKITGNAELEKGQVSAYFLVEGKRLRRTSLAANRNKANLVFTATLPNGEGKLVFVLAPETSIKLRQISVEKLI